MAMWRSSASRLALVYLVILVVAVSVVRFTTYLVTQREITRQADLLVQTELQALREQYGFGGVQRLVEILNRRVDDWGRLGAVYLFMDNAGNKLAGNLTGWPQEARRDGAWLEFELVAREGGAERRSSGARQRHTAGQEPAAGGHRRVRAGSHRAPAAQRDDLEYRTDRAAGRPGGLVVQPAGRRAHPRGGLGLRGHHVRATVAPPAGRRIRATSSTS